MKIELPKVEEIQYTSWCSILDFYHQNKSQLNEEEILHLYKESEKCRNHFKHDESEMTSSLNSRAKKILKDKWNGSVTNSHSIAR